MLRGEAQGGDPSRPCAAVSSGSGLIPNFLKRRLHLIDGALR
jgi:hypothetical protein